jgi:hypothetical protein
MFESFSADDSRDRFSRVDYARHDFWAVDCPPRGGLDRMRLLTRTRSDSLRSALVIAGVLMFLVAPSAEAASPKYAIGTYSGTTSQSEHLTLFVVDSACPGSNSPVRPCLCASGSNNLELMVATTCPGGSSGSSFGVELDPSVIPGNGVVNQRQGLSPGTLVSHIVLTTHHAATGYFIAQANGCTSGRSRSPSGGRGPSSTSDRRTSRPGLGHQ